ncbi:thioredoxin TrxC [Loktanella salsilacus]|uniref:thioredoxin TrxC n=1 Tax=Loktanella salsilacus TaxID=195913 RepID=UPI0037041436
MAGLKLTCLSCAQVNRVPADRLAAAKCATCGAKLADGKVTEVDLATLQKAARNDDLPLVADFWAPWCGPCKMMASQFAQAAGALAYQARLVKLNTEMQPKANTTYGIRGIPTLIAFKGGKEVKRQAGAQQMAQIMAWVPE